MHLRPQPSARGGRLGMAARRTWRDRRGWVALTLLTALTTGGTGAQTQVQNQDALQLVPVEIRPIATASVATRPPSPPPPSAPTPSVAPIFLRRWSPAAHDRVPFRPGRFESEIRAYENADRAAPPPPGAVLFVGSSSIRVWKTLQDDFEGIPVLNRGFGGSQIEDLIHYSKRIIQPYYARRIVIYAGDNDINAGKTPDEVLDAFRTLIDIIRRRQPRAVIAFVSIKPSPARASKVEQIRETNHLIREFCESQRNVKFIDVFTKMVDENGRPRRELYHRDGLHMTPQGYAIWATELSQFVRAARGPTVMGSSR